MDKLTSILVDIAACTVVGVITYQATASWVWAFAMQLLTVAYGMYNFGHGHNRAMAMVKRVMREVREELNEVAEGEAE